MAEIDELSGHVVDAAVRIHRELGPGLLESVYELVLAGSLARRGLRVDRQRPIDITFDGEHYPAAFRIDLMIENKLLVEIKSVERLGARQATSYVLAPHSTPRRAASQFFVRHDEGRDSPCGQ